MSTTTASGSGKRNNGGTVVNGGNVEGSTKALGVNALATSIPNKGSLVVADTATGPIGYKDPHGVIAAKSAGTGGLAYTPAAGTNFIMLHAGDNASKINNSASTLLSVAGGNNVGSINSNLVTTQVGTYATKEFNVFAVPSSGVFPGLTNGTGAGSSSSYVQADDGTTSAIDDAARPTRSVPGELTYMFGGASPKLDTYKAKNVAES